MSTKKLIGLYGGAFDPVHNAHIEIAKNCINEVGLAKLILIPTGRSSFNKEMSPAMDRMAMLKLAFTSSSYEVSSLEIKHSEKSKNLSYTIETIKYFFGRDKNTYLLIIGTDALANMSDWYNWQEIINYCHILVVNRSEMSVFTQIWNPKITKLINDHSTTQLTDLQCKRTGSLYFISMPMIDISSSMVRQYIKNKKNLDGIIPFQIEKYILENLLY